MMCSFLPRVHSIEPRVLYLSFVGVGSLYSYLFYRGVGVFGSFRTIPSLRTLDLHPSLVVLFCTHEVYSDVLSSIESCGNHTPPPPSPQKNNTNLVTGTGMDGLVTTYSNNFLWAFLKVRGPIE